MVSVIAPPRQSDFRTVESTVEPDRGGEALVKEAQGHARRRRRRVAAIAALAASVVVAGAVGVALIGGGTGPTDQAPSGDSGAPAVGVPEPRAPAELIASWAEFHDGWVRVYADGTVLLADDRGARDLPPDEHGWQIFERQLTPAGVSLVRAESLTARKLAGPLEQLPAGVWADSAFEPFEPATEALCYWKNTAISGTFVPAGAVLNALPAQAKALAYGTEHTFDVVWPYNDKGVPDQAACFRMTPAAADSFRVLSRWAPLGAVDGSGRLALWSQPVLPDGVLVLWGG